MTSATAAAAKLRVGSAGNFPRGQYPLHRGSIMNMVNWLWIKYYTFLWCVRCYLWNPFVDCGNRLFDQADIQVRSRVGKFIHK